MPAPKASGVGSVSTATVGVEHLRVRQQVGRDDRPARSQVLVDLQRRVLAAAPRRHEDVGRLEVGGDLVGRPLAGEDRGRADARRRPPRPRALRSGPACPPASISRASGTLRQHRLASPRTAGRAPGTPRTCRCTAPSALRRRTPCRGADVADARRRCRVARTRRVLDQDHVGTRARCRVTTSSRCRQITITTSRARDHAALERTGRPPAAAATG